ncbi:MAG: acyl-CoA synthetase [Sphingobium sp.]
MGRIMMGDQVVTQAVIRDRIARAATGLQSLGVRPGDGIALILRNEPAFFEAGQAASMIGAFPVAVNWHGTVDEVRYILEDCGARVVIGHADLLRKLGGAIGEGTVVLSVPTPVEVAAAYGLRPADGEVPAGAMDWSLWIQRFDPLDGDPATPPNTIIYTSGTTGRPKGVRRQTMEAGHLAVIRRVLGQCYGFTGEDPASVTTAVIGPIYHSAPNAHGNFAFGFGADIVMAPRFDAEGLLRDIERHRITHLNMVPIMFARLLKLPEEVRSRYDLSSLRFVAHAAAPCPAPIKRAMIDWWGPIINEYYGSTEMGNLTFCTSREWLAHPGTVGRVMPDVEVRVIGPGGDPLPPHEIGEVLGRTHGIPEFTYHGDDQKRAEAEKFGLIAGGDIGYFDTDGFLYLCDRAKDMIISGGVNIYPAEIEAELHKMPEVADCAVFGIPDEEFGEAVCAVIQLQPDARADIAHIKAFLREGLSGFKVPRKITFEQSLPREDSGKIFKRKLREPYWAGVGRAI